VIQDYDGADVIDIDGERIGKVERSYIDDRGTVKFVEVRFGTILKKHRLVPVEDADQQDDGLHVPYTKRVVEDSPDASSSNDTLEGPPLEEARAYYEQTMQPAAGPDEVAEEPGAVPVGQAKSDDGTASPSEDESVGGRIRHAVEEVRDKLPGGSGGENDRG